MSNQHLLSETLSQKTVFNGLIIDVAHMQVRLPNGEEMTLEAVLHKGAGAVVPVDAADAVGAAFGAAQRRIDGDAGLVFVFPVEIQLPHACGHSVRLLFCPLF